MGGATNPALIPQTCTGQTGARRSRTSKAVNLQGHWRTPPCVCRGNARAGPDQPVFIFKNDRAAALPLAAVQRNPG
ncbi:hypothetical protein BFJ63_vAg18621, partial [Fusarium oxysporum f. sp. narcissi]